MAPLCRVGLFFQAPFSIDFSNENVEGDETVTIESDLFRFHPSPPDHLCGFLSLLVSGFVSVPAQLKSTSL